MTDVELLIDLKVFRQAVLALGSVAQLVLEYPTKDNKLLVCVKDDWHSTRFYLNTFVVEEVPRIDLAELVQASFAVRDSRILKQALEVCCHGRHEVDVFVSFNSTTQSCLFTRSDATVGMKTRVALPQEIGTEVEESSERLYSSKVLRGIANFPKTEKVQVNMHHEGVLEFCLTFSDRAWFRHFVSPTPADPDFCCL